jgi:hypothetical protein
MGTKAAARDPNLASGERKLRRYRGNLRFSVHVALAHQPF